MSRERNSAAADEVNDFKAVIRLDLGLGPLRARKKVEIALDGDPPGREAEMLKQGGDAEAMGNLARLAVDDDRHCGVLDDGVLGLLRMAKRISSFAASARA